MLLIRKSAGSNRPINSIGPKDARGNCGTPAGEETVMVYSANISGVHVPEPDGLENIHELIVHNT